MDPTIQNQLRNMVAKLLERQNNTFPGAQPVSFCRAHIHELKKEDYYVCEKSDGQRYLLFNTTDPNGDEATFLIDRRNDYWLVRGLHFPLTPDKDPIPWHKDTLIDGELVIDKNPDGSKTAKFLMFDCLVMDGKILINRTLDKRLAYLSQNFYNPYKVLLKKFPQEVPFMPFLAQMKKMEFAYATEMLFRQILPSLPHGNDGLIFTCVNSPYTHGTDNKILKWKPENENSIDFKMQLEFPLVKPDAADLAAGVTEPWPDYDAIPTVNLFSGGDNDTDMWFSTMALEEWEWEKLKSLGEPLQDRIVECYMDEKRRWRYMRFRDDKDKGNFHRVVQSVIQSIMDRVTSEELCANAKAIKDAWKSEGRTKYRIQQQQQPAQGQ